MLIAQREGARAKGRLGTADREADAEPMRDEGIPLDLPSGRVKTGGWQSRVRPRDATDASLVLADEAAKSVGDQNMKGFVCHDGKF